MLYPIIMCGGDGTRLWPASRPDRPKPFIPLAGSPTLFAQTLGRIRALPDAAPPLIVGGAAHARLIEDALAEASLPGTVVIEPVGRDSGPAMAAAAWLVRQRDPAGVCLFLAADHHIPDTEAFARVIGQAVDQALLGGLVTLGVKPTWSSTAYGYIRPVSSAHGGVRPVEAFVEKPTRDKADRLIADGCLWNCGILVARATTLLEELQAHAPEIATAAGAAVAGGRTEAGHFLLGDAFLEAPKLSMDFAVLEHTDVCFVVPADFEWSDIGTWDTVLGCSVRDADGNNLSGAAFAQSSSGCLIQAGPGVTIAVAGVHNIAVIAERGQVMISDLGQAGDLKRLVERARASDQPSLPPLGDIGARLRRWMDVSALPLWWSLGADHGRGGFHETLGLDGRPSDIPRRLRVQARQTHVFAQAGGRGWSGPWRQAVDHGLSYLQAAYRRPDGLYRTQVSETGGVLDDTALLYDQAFVLLALATAAGAGVEPGRLEEDALQLLSGIDRTFGHDRGGWREQAASPFQANPHMHLLEACLAWMAVSADPRWLETAGRIVALARDRLIDPAGGFLGEHFDADWTLAGEPGRQTVEPGHQFEWAFLLGRWVMITGDQNLRQVPGRLYAAGQRGLDRRRGVACDEMNTDLGITRSTARLWPQCEWIKASILLAGLEPDRRDIHQTEAAQAATGLFRYLETNIAGLYRDRMDITGQFRIEDAPASSLYHIAGAVETIQAGLDLR
ncbi:AGE family epimerase/isomerase [Caulobacter sp. NIBR1757]|uniref:AGE family epimerase/isomerase n=1 Tax=Caulobacter sp. NIBR1757 TaxID=3016000 RepID=UPI0022EFE36C|nr:AGE family epimerase/isomerase [Caulobacter sp. NIBR1757]WGM40054.1 Cellobiose 2-epimerase [Caulobacter sp. NIBR1757]